VSTLKLPARVKNLCPEPAVSSTTKKPFPSTPTSRPRPVNSNVPWVNICVTAEIVLPLPTEIEDAPPRVPASKSAKSARDDLNPVVFWLAILSARTEIAVP